MTCGCTNAKPNIIPHTLIIEATQNSRPVHAAAADIPGRPKSAVRSLRTAAAAMHAAGTLATVPPDWQP